MTRVVVDASFAIKWVLIEKHHVEATALLLSWKADEIELAVPSWFACEVANVLFRRVRDETLTIDDARLALVELLAFVTPREYEPDVSLRALELAHTHDQQASYDSHYLALAERLDCELWTADLRFRRAIGAAYPRLRWVGEVA